MFDDTSFRLYVIYCLMIYCLFTVALSPFKEMTYKQSNMLIEKNNNLIQNSSTNALKKGLGYPFKLNVTHQT